MVKVRDIGENERPPECADWVLIEQTPSGRFMANGSASGKMDATFFRPPSFDTVDAAIAASRAWAEANDVPVIYVRDIT
jgi:hypothetical protein